MPGVVSVENYGDADVEVAFSLYDDYGTHVADARVAVLSGRTQWANVTGLERGDSDRNITAVPHGKPRGSVLWATLVEPSEVQVLAYARALAGGYVVPMSRTTEHRQRDDGTWRAYVPFFTPASNGAVRTPLRLMNPTERERTLWVYAWDGEGIRTSDITCRIPPMGGIRLTARDLENGPSVDECSSLGWGDGAGKWYIRIDDQEARAEPLIVMAINHFPRTGLQANVSFPWLTYLGEAEGTIVPTGDLAPQDDAAFWTLVEGRKLVM